MFKRTSDDSSRFSLIIQDEEKYDDTFKEIKRPQTHSSYVTLLGDIIDAEPSIYEEVAKKKGKESTR